MGTEGFSQSTLRGSPLKGHLSFGLISDIFFSGGIFEHRSCTEQCFALNLTRSSLMAVQLQFINNFNVVFITFDKEDQVKHAVG